MSEMDELVGSTPFKRISRSQMSEIEQSLFLVPSRNDDDKSRSKKLLFRIVQALHSCGNLSYKTEDTVQTVARSLDMYAVCSVYPVTVSITFNESSVMSPKNTETYVFRIARGVDCSKHQQLDELCTQLESRDIDVYMAERRLKEIEESQSMYPWYVIAAAHALVSAAGSALFYNGGLLDASIGFFLGLAVYVVNRICALAEGLPQIECFLSAFIVVCLCYFINEFIVTGSCAYAQIFGGVVWLLPGFTIIISLLEIFSNSIVCGSARLVYGVSLASQLGFGIVMGCGFLYPEVNIPDSFQHGCVSPFPTIVRVLVLLPIMSISNAILVNTSYRHLFLIIAVCLCGEMVGILIQYVDISSAFKDNVSSTLGAIIVTIAARVCGGRHYYVFLVNGMLILVPGAVGVKGMSDMWSGDMLGGINFTFKMFMVGVCLAIGVFMALIPKARWFKCCGRTKGKYFPIAEMKSGKIRILRASSNGIPEDEIYDGDLVLQHLESPHDMRGYV